MSVIGSATMKELADVWSPCSGMVLIHIELLWVLMRLAGT
jgi:hypothetical protein